MEPNTPRNPFLDLAEEMNLYHSIQDQALGRVIGHSAHLYQLSSSTVATMLRAIIAIAQTPERALFSDVVVSTYIQLYSKPDEAVAVLERIAAFLSKCGSIEEFETIVAKSTQTPPPQDSK